MSWADTLYEEYVFYCHHDDRDIIGYEEFDTFELLVTRSDGTKDLYNSLKHAYRRIYPEKQDVITMGKEKYAMEFGWKLDSKITNAHITIEELSEKTGISPTSLYLYARGERIPNFYTVILLADALDCDLNEFLRIPK